MVCYILVSPYLDRLFYPLDFEESIRRSAAEHQIDPMLVAAVIHTESSFRPAAVSHRGARGLMQIMPSTGEWAADRLGYRDYHPDLLFQPGYNIDLGTWYLSDLLKQFDSNITAALAAYNGGRGQVGKWLEQGIWDGSEENLDQVPYSETRNFVGRVLKAYRRYQEIY